VERLYRGGGEVKAGGSFGGVTENKGDWGLMQKKSK